MRGRVLLIGMEKEPRFYRWAWMRYFAETGVIRVAYPLPLGLAIRWTLAAVRWLRKKKVSLDVANEREAWVRWCQRTLCSEDKSKALDFAESRKGSEAQRLFVFLEDERMYVLAYAVRGQGVITDQSKDGRLFGYKIKLVNGKWWINRTPGVQVE
jgi:hypothetical protein